MADGAALTLDAARELLSAGKVWPLLRDFLWNFAPLVDGARVATLATHPALAGLLKPPYAKGLAETILAHVGVTPVFYAFPPENGSRLLLLPRETYEQLARWLGVVLYAEGLRTVLNGAQVRMLRQQLGGAYPEALNYTAYFSKWGAVLEAVREALPPVPAVLEVGFAGAVRAAGFRMLASLLREVPAAVWARQRVRFPVADEPLFEPLPAEVLSSERLDLLFLLLKLRFPEANDLCS